MKLVGYDGVTRQPAEGGAVQEEDKEWQVRTTTVHVE